MPFNVVSNDSRCPASKPYAVIGGQSGHDLFGCHPDKDSARRQQQALYAQVDDARQDAGPASGEDEGPGESEGPGDVEAPDTDDALPSPAQVARPGFGPGMKVPKHKGKHHPKEKVYPPIAYSLPATVWW